MFYMWLHSAYVLMCIQVYMLKPENKMFFRYQRTFFSSFYETGSLIDLELAK